MSNDDRRQSRTTPNTGTPSTVTRNTVTRRTALQAGAIATGALAMPSLAAASAARDDSAGATRGPGKKVTVVLFQRGGADHLNIYAPTGDPDYATLRPTIGIGAPGSSAAVVGTPMTAAFSMHPVMTGISTSFSAANSRFAVVQAVGYQPFNRSHFESQDLYETSLGGGATEGWINRHLQVTSTANDAPVRALALSGALPRSMLGSYPCYAVSSTQDLLFSGAADSRVLLEAVAAGTPTGNLGTQHALAYQSQQDTFALLDLFAGLDPNNYTPANGANYPPTALGQSLRETAELIKSGLGIEFFAIDQGGWDHHSGLGARIAINARDLSDSITAFFIDLGTLADNVVLTTMSEFGRTAAENGSGGTDHGAGGAMLVAGGSGTAVNGGQVHGVWPGLAPAALADGKFLMPSNDYRDVLREVLDVHMGGTDPATVFPGRTYQPIGVL